MATPAPGGPLLYGQGQPQEQQAGVCGQQSSQPSSYIPQQQPSFSSQQTASQPTSFTSNQGVFNASQCSNQSMYFGQQSQQSGQASSGQVPLLLSSPRVYTNLSLPPLSCGDSTVSTPQFSPYLDSVNALTHDDT